MLLHALAGVIHGTHLIHLIHIPHLIHLTHLIHLHHAVAHATTSTSSSTVPSVHGSPSHWTHVTHVALVVHAEAPVHVAHATHAHPTASVHVHLGIWVGAAHALLPHHAPTLSRAVTIWFPLQQVSGDETLWFIAHGVTVQFALGLGCDWSAVGQRESVQGCLSMTL